MNAANFLKCGAAIVVTHLSAQKPCYATG